MLVDTHAHVQFAKYKEDAHEVMRRALDAGMTVINVGSQIDTSRQAVQMLPDYPERVYAVVGLHPVHTFKHEFFDSDELDSSFFTREEVFDYEAYRTLADNPRVVGIGECGLDYFRLPENQDIGEIKSGQRAAFLEQIRLARELNKALVIHCRPSQGTVDAYEDVLEILKSENSNQKAGSSEGALRFEVHCFTGPLSIARRFIELGGYIGLNGIITFDKTGVSEEVVNNISLEHIILETDSPYLTPVPHRGKRNEPAYVELVAKKIAEWKQVSFEEVADITTANAKRLFRIV